MTPEHPLAEYLDFTFSFFGKPEIRNSEIKVPIRDFSVLRGFPGFEQSRVYKQGSLVFEGVISSVRMIQEYKPGRTDDFKPAYTITDGPFDEVHEEAYLFYLGGYSYDPLGWVEWDIIAVSVCVGNESEIV